jgi:very-short-patch-repair endonuclease
MDNLEETIRCPVCGKEFKQLGNHLRFKHGLTGQETKEKFGLDCLVSPAERARMSENAPAKRPEVRKKISQSKMGVTPSLETIRKMSESRIGKSCPPEVREKIRLSQKGKPRPQTIGERNGFYGKHHSNASKEQMIMSRDGKHFAVPMPKCRICGKELTSRTAEYCRKHQGETIKGDNNPSRRPEVIEKIKGYWEDVEFVRMMMKKRHAKPNKQERKLNKILLEITSGEYHINVKADILVVGSKIPDFVNVNGQKKLIELFGDYWHGESRTGISEEEHEKERMNFFAQYGYETLIIWEHELENVDKLKKKILDFHTKRTFNDYNQNISVEMME